ncbi:response regulator [Bacillus norwichensis]|uniref:Response regulator n=1 Tax=Bacillus norwichensis TaxID=2762217 RepID=A0ABR8VKP6_9BACI|nr:response regulator [Bacillus norwichensis]MBD8005340.1 response regulator [Bacillus norwichensis]
MTAILIDHDLLALNVLEEKLIQNGKIEVIGKYTNPYQGLVESVKNQPAVVFLEIEFDGISGIELAKQIQKELPDTKIVFVTSNDRYAVDAFELMAADYIMKPVQVKRLSETINRLLELTSKKTESFPMVSCFHTIHFIYYGNDIEEIEVKWRTAKTKELFAYLIHHRNQSIRKDVLLELFWNQEDLKSGYSQLYTAIYHIRRMLKSIGFNITINSLENSYRLELNDVLLDVDVWEKGMEGETRYITRSRFLKQRKILDLYKGDFVGEEDYSWAENERKRLRALWLSHVKKMADYMIYNENRYEAIALYLRVQKILPYQEDSYIILMQLYDALGDRYSVQEQYEKLKSMLKEEYDTIPDKSIQQWFQQRRVRQINNSSIRAKRHLTLEYK